MEQLLLWAVVVIQRLASRNYKNLVNSLFFLFSLFLFSLYIPHSFIHSLVLLCDKAAHQRPFLSLLFTSLESVASVGDEISFDDSGEGGQLMVMMVIMMIIRDECNRRADAVSGGGDIDDTNTHTHTETRLSTQTQTVLVVVMMMVMAATVMILLGHHHHHSAAVGNVNTLSSIVMTRKREESYSARWW